ncbi:hypothetical protein [Geoglobus acetivorans]|uniref:Uncharacterized protein n=1 Tax=Geoglobus acetivorans TaxID=565033 RepID=A0ABZ3H4B6_GEOAI|nr:hypothetical protein [Geoglobus acetivorans]
MTEIVRRLELLEREIRDLKSLIFSKEDPALEKKLVSLRGMGKPLAEDDEIENAIEEAKKSIFPKIEDDLRN